VSTIERALRKFILVDGLRDGHAKVQVQVSSHKGGAQARPPHSGATGDARHFINAEIERDRFCSDAGAAAVFFGERQDRNLYTRSTQREQIRDLNIATDTKPAQLRLSQ